jgi:hypothetical protein
MSQVADSAEARLAFAALHVRDELPADAAVGSEIRLSPSAFFPEAADPGTKLLC